MEGIEEIKGMRLSKELKQIEKRGEGFR